MNTVIIILARGAERATFDRHLPYWRSHKLPIFVVTPMDDPLISEYHTWVHKGPSAHTGVNSIRRHKDMYHWILDMRFDACWVFEYDSLCLSPELPRFCDNAPATLAGPVFQVNGDNTRHPIFEGKQFIHHPLYWNKSAVQEILPLLDALPDDAEHGCWDRQLGLLLPRTSIIVCDLRAHGAAYSANTIDNAHYAEASAAAESGATLFHGVKSAEALQMLIVARDKYLASVV